MEVASNSDQDTDQQDKLVSDEAYIVMSYIVLIVFVIFLVLICLFNIWEKKRVSRVWHIPLDEVEKTKQKRTMLKKSHTLNESNMRKIPKLSSDLLPT